MCRLPLLDALVAALLLAMTLLATAAAGSVGEPHRPFEIQSHRGAGELAPGNSMAAFRQAIAMGVDTLEMDAQATLDRVLVVYHDQRIDASDCRRVDGSPLRSRLLKELTLREVEAIRCREGAAIPTLDAVLRLASSAPYPVRANVEIKMQKAELGIPVTEFAALLVVAIEESGMSGRVLVQSFEPEALLAMRRIAPEIPRAVISRDRGSYSALVEETTASALLPRRDRLEPEDVEAMHARGVAVIPWVVDDTDEMRRLRTWGVDGIITNRPDVALEFRDGRAPLAAEPEPPPPTPWPPPAPATAPSPQTAPPAASPVSPPAQPAAVPPVVGEAPSRAYTIGEVRKVAVYYFTSAGKTDTFLTSLFLEELGRRHSQQLIDPYQLADQPRDGQAYHPAGMQDKLFAEAARNSAQAIIIGVGKWYGTGIRGFRLEVRLIEVGTGRVLWQATAASGRSGSGPSAKREVVRKVLKSYPGIRRR